MITAAELHSSFNTIIDESQTDNFIDTEIDEFLNNAQLILFKQFAHPDGVPTEAQKAGHNAYFDSNQKLSQYMAPFKRSWLNKDTNADAQILYSDLEAIEPTRTIYGYMDIEVQCPSHQEFFPAQYKSRQEANKQLKMEMYAPDCCHPWIVVEKDYFQLYPNNVDELDYNLYYLVLPQNISLSGSVDCEFDYELKPNLVWKAVEIAATSIRDDRMAQRAQNMYLQAGI